MARSVDKLSARAVETLKGPGRFSDGGGLYLVIDPSGARRWMFIFRHGGKQREMGLGGLGSVSLADARRRRDEARKILAEGGNPIADRRQTRIATVKAATTFGSFVDELLPELVKGFRNPKHASQWRTTIETYAATLRPKPIDEVSTDDVLTVLQPIWTTKSETASRLRGRIERVLDAAKARGLRSGENPARWRGHLDHLLPKRRRLTRGHHRALPFAEVPTFVARLRERQGTAARALEFLILTAGRSGEVLGARWNEIDQDKALWTIPGDRMKAGREHRVPLSPRALAIVKEMRPISRGDLVFESYEANRPLSNMAFDALLTRMKVEATAHGFRSSFRDWAGECTDVAREVAEAALAHTVGDETERAYRRGDALEKRRLLMREWLRFVDAVPGKGK